MFLVGGTFDENGGKSSYIIQQLGEELRCGVMNGGSISELQSFDPEFIDVLIWMPNISNSEDKIVPRLKPMNPRMTLVTSKRVIENQYSDFEIVSRMLKVHANLCIKITKYSYGYAFSLIDPLGNIYVKDTNITGLVFYLTNRINFLSKMKRVSSIKMRGDNKHLVNNEFIDIVKDYGNKFSNIIQAINPERFLGNASTRCTHGFPSARAGNNEVLVSRRNVNKEEMTSDDFVLVKNVTGTMFVKYMGNNKPSVDTPIQLELYKHYRNINYFIHGHCYIKDAEITEEKYPCGDLRELDGIYSIIKDKETKFILINLKGHGCLIGADNLEMFNDIKLIPRPFLEHYK